MAPKDTVNLLEEFEFLNFGARSYHCIEKDTKDNNNDFPFPINAIPSRLLPNLYIEMGMYKGMGRMEAIVMMLIYTFFQVWRIYTDYIVYPVAQWFKQGKSKPLPAIRDKILVMSAVEIANRIRNKQVTSVQVVQSFIRRLREINPILNAVTDERYSDALKDAQKADEIIAQCNGDIHKLEQLKKHKPFLGVPITTKNALAVQGLGNDAGLCLRKNYKAPVDSDAMSRMRASGAIPLAVTNTPELCLWCESSNVLHGTTNNPYNTYRTPGGSSGGEGAILSSGGSPFGIGTDIAGSIRIPSFYCGLFGLKPTIETVSIEGHYPMAGDILKPLLIAGPMCKYSEDLKPTLRVLVGEANAHKMKLDREESLNRCRMFYMEGIGSKITTPVTEEIKNAVRKVATHLATLSNTKAQTTQFSELAYSMEIYIAYLVKAKVPSYSQELTMRKGELSQTREWIKYWLGLSKHTLPSLSVVSLEKIGQAHNDSKLVDGLILLGKTLEEKMEKFLKDDTMIVLPTFPVEAPYHGMSVFRPANFGYTGIFNILGFPAIHVPTGLAKSGMPIGVTIIANKFRDNLLISAAREIDSKLGGWKSPCPVKI